MALGQITPPRPARQPGQRGSSEKSLREVVFLKMSTLVMMKVEFLPKLGINCPLEERRPQGIEQPVSQGGTQPSPPTSKQKTE